MNQTDTDSIRFSLKNEIAKIRSLPKGKRLEYIWDYYRAAIFGTAFALFLFCCLGTFLVNLVIGTLFPKEPLTIAFAVTDFVNNEAWMEDCLEAIGYDGSREHFQAMATAPHNDTRDDFRITTTVWFANGQPDIFIVDETSYRYLAELGVLSDLTQVWPEDLLALAEGRMAGSFGVEVTDTDLARAYNISGEPVYLCMMVTGAGFERALDMAEYILS